jgi:hypothetical protein
MLMRLLPRFLVVRVIHNWWIWMYAPFCGQASCGLYKLLEIPEYQDRYTTAVIEILEKYFNSNWLTQQIDILRSAIDSYVQADDKSFYSYDQYLPEILGEMKELRALLDKELITPDGKWAPFVPQHITNVD